MIGFLLILGYWIWACIYFYNYKHTGTCKGIEVTMKSGQKSNMMFMNQRDVLAELKQINFKAVGEPRDSINIYRIEQILRSNPLFDDAEVYLSPKTNKLNITIEQKEPMFIVQTGDSLYYVSSGRGIIPCNPKYAVKVPLVSGYLTEDYAKKQVYDLIKTIQDNEHWKYYFAQIYVGRDNNIMLTPRLSTTQIIMGRTPNWQEKLDNLQLFEEKVIPIKGWNSYKSLNLEFEGQVVAQLANPVDTLSLR